MNVLAISHTDDIGGQGIRIKEAFDRHAPGWIYHSIARPSTFGLYMRYPADLPWSAAKETWSEADVVHLRNDFRVAQMLEGKQGEKPAVVHYHGSLFRTDPWRRLAEQRKRGSIGLVSTLDLLLIAPDDLEWLPSPYNLDWLASLKG